MADRIVFTLHARERLVERSGLRQPEVCSRVHAALVDASKGYWPNQGVFPGEFWVVVDGPRGKATAVCQRTAVGATVVTIRESETVGQGERATEHLTHRPFASLSLKKG